MAAVRVIGLIVGPILQGLNGHNERLGKVRLFGKCNAKKKKKNEKSMSGQSDQLI